MIRPENPVCPFLHMNVCDSGFSRLHPVSLQSVWPVMSQSLLRLSVVPVEQPNTDSPSMATGQRKYIPKTTQVSSNRWHMAISWPVIYSCLLWLTLMSTNGGFSLTLMAVLSVIGTPLNGQPCCNGDVNHCCAGLMCPVRPSQLMCIKSPVSY